MPWPIDISSFPAADRPLKTNGIEQTGIPMQRLQIPLLSEGETYIGAIGDKNGNLYHVILLPGDNDGATCQAQMDWAKSIGGDLPNRVEQAMLLANFSDQFQDDLYWSNTQSESYSYDAWGQYFGSGYQYDLRKTNEFRARAVRRMKVQ